MLDEQAGDPLSPHAAPDHAQLNPGIRLRAADGRRFYDCEGECSGTCEKASTTDILPACALQSVVFSWQHLLTSGLHLKPYSNPSLDLHPQEG
jgi:hypothetical protein